MQKPKGTKDVFGFTKKKYQVIIDSFRDIVTNFNFKEIETPIFEFQDVFVHSVGENSDIVTKEMYLFEDRKGRKMALRPEGTSGVMRAIAENKLLDDGNNKLFYIGPMFRYENPQRGRQRQHTQIGLEFLCERNPYYDVEIIYLAHQILEKFNIKTTLKLNYLATLSIRNEYIQVLKDYFRKYEGHLTSISLKRLSKNPMRILDDKVENKKDFVINAPKISEFYDQEAKNYFKTVTKLLDSLNINYEIDPLLVRGLDYYSDTIFEFVSEIDDISTTLIAGGRYNELPEKFGLMNQSGIGFGIGLERLALFVDDNLIKRPSIDFYVVNLDQNNAYTERIFIIVQRLRKVSRVEYDINFTKISKAWKIAEKLNAKGLIFLGANELENKFLNIKYNNEQKVINFSNLESGIREFLDEIN